MGGERQIHLIKLHNLKYNAHDKNYKIILTISCIDMREKSTFFFFPRLIAELWIFFYANFLKYMIWF